MRIKRFCERLVVVAAMPLLISIEVARYSAIQRSNAAKVLTFVQFIPIIVVTTAIWAGLWMIAIGAVGQMWRPF